MSKKELVLSAIRGEAVERIPVGFQPYLKKVSKDTKSMLKKYPLILSRL